MFLRQVDRLLFLLSWKKAVFNFPRTVNRIKDYNLIRQEECKHSMYNDITGQPRSKWYGQEIDKPTNLV